MLHYEAPKIYIYTSSIEISLKSTAQFKFLNPFKSHIAQFADLIEKSYYLAGSNFWTLLGANHITHRINNEELKFPLIQIFEPKHYITNHLNISHHIKSKTS